MSRVAVVGGGLAGTLAALRLLEAGHRVQLREAGPALGGMIAPVDLAGALVDAGAEAYAVRGGVGRALCAEFGIEVAGPSGAAHIWRPAGAYRMAEGVVGIPATLDDPALEALTPEGRAAVAREAELGPEVGADATTVGALVRARLGEEALATLVEPVTRGVYATPADHLPLAAMAPGLIAALRERGSLLAAVAATRANGPTVEQPVGGMFRLIAEIGRRVREAGGDVRCAAPVVTLARDGDELFLTTADGETLRADRVVLATPAAVAARLLAQVGVEIEPPAVRSARFAVLAVSTPALADDPVGSGVLVADPVPELKAKALTHYSAKWPWARAEGREMLRLSYPADVEPTLDQAVADASLLTGVDIETGQVAAFASVEWAAMPARIDPVTRDRFLGDAAGIGVDLVGAWIDGNGIAPVILGVERVLG
ncbi:MAG TPA: FAD-dependent oxidoreductase [Arachnia sp.]|nr:FAD-dependent oxidoreductase [Arachnia sp.]